MDEQPPAWRQRGLRRYILERVAVVAAAAAALGAWLSLSVFESPALIGTELAERAERRCAELLMERPRLPDLPETATFEEELDQYDTYVAHHERVIPELRKLEGAENDPAFRDFLADFERFTRLERASIEATWDEDEYRATRAWTAADRMRDDLFAAVEANHLGVCAS